ncbi:MAG: DUF169 domain-containing protein [Desulfomonile tiedjei]|uniref:DUF169 domain-containing protein n=1 Tax=Desulfomonile tiedjei TaxID=2358 RepID=A0A9D6YZZ8_9BACT|nr:DUF169 domain-containing protein [Desulfomonile tiedjei]
MNPEDVRWSEWTRGMERFLRLKTFPVGLKLLSDSDSLSNNPWIRKPPEKLSLCQLITIARTFDWTVGGTAEDLATPGCASILGLSQLPEFVTDGTMRNVVWLEKKEDAALCESVMQRIPFGKYKAFMLAPTAYDPFVPDIVLIYGNPAQMSLMVNAIQYDRFERLVFYSVGESSCSDVIGRCFVDRVPALSIPCYGERRFGHAADDELAIGLPAEDCARILTNLETLYKKGVRYPISNYGAQVNPMPALNAVYNFSELQTKKEP